MRDRAPWPALPEGDQDADMDHGFSRSARSDRGDPSDVDELEYGLEGMQIEPDDDEPLFLHGVGTVDDTLENVSLSHTDTPRSAARPIRGQRKATSDTPMANGDDDRDTPNSGAESHPAASFAFSMSPDRLDGIPMNSRSESSTTLSISAGPASPPLLGAPGNSAPKRSSLSRSLRAPASMVPPSSEMLRGSAKDIPLRLLKPGAKTPRPPSYKMHSPFLYSSMPASRRYSVYAGNRTSPFPPSPVSVSDAAAVTEAASILAGSGHARVHPTGSPGVEDGDETDEEVPVCLGQGPHSGTSLSSVDRSERQQQVDNEGADDEPPASTRHYVPGPGLGHQLSTSPNAYERRSSVGWRYGPAGPSALSRSLYHAPSASALPQPVQGHRATTSASSAQSGGLASKGTQHRKSKAHLGIYDDDSDSIPGGSSDVADMDPLLEGRAGSVATASTPGTTGPAETAVAPTTAGAGEKPDPPTVKPSSPKSSVPSCLGPPDTASKPTDAASVAKAVTAIRSQMGGSANCPAFVTKLWYLLDKAYLYQKYICWSQAGDKILIAADTATSNEFATEVLPTLYRHNNLASFVRQLNLYGFQRISNTRPLDPDEIHLAVSKNLLSTHAAGPALAAALVAQADQSRADQYRAESESQANSQLAASYAAEAASSQAAAAALTPGLSAITLYGPHHCFSHPRFQRGHPDWLPLLKPKSSKKPRASDATEHSMDPVPIRQT